MGLLPSALVLMPQHTFERAFTVAHADRLAHLCDLVLPLPCATLDGPATAGRLEQVQIMVTGWGTPRLDRAALAHLPVLRLIAHVGGSVKAIVDPDLLDAGTRITSAVEANARPVAEYTLAFLLLENKGVAEWTRLYQAQRSRIDRRSHSGFATMGNTAKTVGVVGASRVGRYLLRLLEPFDLRPVVYDPYLPASAARALGAELCPLGDLLRQSDVVTLHAPALPSTRHMIGAQELALIRDGSLLINTARGAIVDHAALTAELGSGRLRAVLDVTEPEPLPDDSPLFELPNVVLTPHIAGSLGLEIHRMTDLVLAEIERFLGTRRLAHEVKLEHWDIVA